MPQIAAWPSLPIPPFFLCSLFFKYSSSLLPLCGLPAQSQCIGSLNKPSVFASRTVSCEFLGRRLIPWLEWGAPRFGGLSLQYTYNKDWREAHKGAVLLGLALFHIFKIILICNSLFFLNKYLLKPKNPKPPNCNWLQAGEIQIHVLFSHDCAWQSWEHLIATIPISHSPGVAEHEKRWQRGLLI